MTKPQTASGYSADETDQAIAACLTVVSTLGDLSEEICVVGGLAPLLLIDLQAPQGSQDGHCGTNDLDVGLAIALLNDSRYQEISERLKAKDFGPDFNERGNRTFQRWRKVGLKITIDFLIPGDAQTQGQIKHLESDFAALQVRGLELAFAERVMVRLDRRNLKGHRVERDIPVCGPGAFTILKAFSFARRNEPKDAYDLVYVLERWPGGTRDIADRISHHVSTAPDTVAAAMDCLRKDFASLDHHGARSAAEFADLDARDVDERAADAAGYVDDLLRAVEPVGV